MLTKAVDIPLAGRISHLLVNWQKLTLNQDILSEVKGYTIPFIKIPFQQKKFQILRDQTRSKLLSSIGIKGDIEQKGNKEKSTCSWGVFEQLITCGEKKMRPLAIAM